MNFPTFLTWLRVLAVPVLVVLILYRYEGNQLLILGIFTAAALTDMVDGYLARRNHQVSVFGQLLDPIADKLLITSLFICFIELNLVPAWMVVVIIAREVSITGFRALASSRGIHIPAFLLGKLKMNAETITIGLLILGERYLGNLYILARIGLYVVIAAAVLSALEYFIRFGPRVLKDDPIT